MIKVEQNGLRNAMTELNNCRRSILRQSDEIRVSVDLERLNRLSPLFAERLKKIQDAMHEESKKVTVLEQTLEQISGIYNRTEHTVEGHAERARAHIVKQEVGQNDTSRYMEMLNNRGW